MSTAGEVVHIENTVFRAFQIRNIGSFAFCRTRRLVRLDPYREAFYP